MSMLQLTDHFEWIDVVGVCVCVEVPVFHCVLFRLCFVSNLWC